MSKLGNPIAKKLHGIKLSTLVEGQKVVSVKETDILATCVKVMSDNHVHSCPVLDAKGVCTGVIDMLDAVSHAVTVAPDTHHSYSTIWDPATNVKLAVETAGRALALVQAKAVMNKSGKDNYVPLEMDNEATLAVDVFAQGIHRSPILDKAGQVVGSLSQSALVKWFIAESKTYFKKLDALDLYLFDLGLGGNKVVAVEEDWTMVKALSVLSKAGVSAVPVVNKSGFLVGNLSAVDLIGLYQENLPQFEQSVKNFLKAHAPKSLVTVGLNYRDTTLRNLLVFFEEHPWHRVWILEDGKPVGVVSHTDIMAFIRDYNGN